MTKGQAALEFVLLVGFMFLVFVGFFAVIQGKVGEALESQAKQAIVDQATVLQNEIKTAAVMEDGFQRSIELPWTINGKSYEARFYGDIIVELVLKYEEEPKYESSFILPKNIDVSSIVVSGIENNLQLRTIRNQLCLSKINGKLIIMGGGCS